MLEPTRRAALGRWMPALWVSALLAGIAAAHPAEAGVDRWTPLGPDGGDVQRLVVDPTAAGVLYASPPSRLLNKPPPRALVTAGWRAAWLRGDAGARSTAAGDALLRRRRPVPQLAAHRGLLRSDDGGRSWSELLAQPATAVAIDPGRPEVLLAGAPDLVRSSDAGASWTTVLAGGMGTVDRVIDEIFFDPADPRVVYALGSESFIGSSDEHLYGSRDGGLSWETLAGCCELTIVPGSGSPSAVLTSGGRWRSLDAGLTWQSIDPPGGHLVAAPTRPPTLYVDDGTTVFRSTDLGDTWEPDPLWTERLPSSLAALLAHPAAPERFLAVPRYEGGLVEAWLVGAEPLLLGGCFVESRSSKLEPVEVCPPRAKSWRRRAKCACSRASWSSLALVRPPRGPLGAILEVSASSWRAHSGNEIS